VIIALELRQVSPLALGVDRFVLAAFPPIFYVSRPKAPPTLIAIYCLFIFALRFGILITGMRVGMSAGQSSPIAALLLKPQGSASSFSQLDLVSIGPDRLHGPHLDAVLV
jgi:hypothetical protein